MATKKVTINLPEEQVKFIQKIAEANDMTFTDAIKRAINSEKFFVEQEDSGSKILIEGKDNKLREILRK